MLKRFLDDVISFDITAISTNISTIQNSNTGISIDITTISAIITAIATAALAIMAFSQLREIIKNSKVNMLLNLFEIIDNRSNRNNRRKAWKVYWKLYNKRKECKKISCKTDIKCVFYKKNEENEENEKDKNEVDITKCCPHIANKIDENEVENYKKICPNFDEITPEEWVNIEQLFAELDIVCTIERKIHIPNNILFERYGELIGPSFTYMHYFLEHRRRNKGGRGWDGFYNLGKEYHERFEALKIEIKPLYEYVNTEENNEKTTSNS